MRLIALTLTLLTFSSLARAQEADSPPSATTAPAPPPPAPPAPAAPAPAPPTPRWIGQPSAEELIARGHTKKVAGGTLLVIGTLASLAGSIMIIADAVTLSNCHYGGCQHGSIFTGGVVLDLIATPMIAAGIATYVVGGAQMARGERMLSGGAQAANALFRF